MRFKLAVESVPALKGAYRTGLQALNNRHKNLITADGNNLTGSVNLDESLKKGEHAQASRWDYGIGYKINNFEVAVWVEVHPASSTGNLNEVVEKLKWLNKFLSGKWQSQLRAMTFRQYFWVATGRVNPRLSRKSRPGRMLSRTRAEAARIHGPLQHLNLEEALDEVKR